MKNELLSPAGEIAVGENVILARSPERDIEITPLVIGEGARVRSGTVIYACSTIGRDLETGHNVVIREQNEIGDGLSIWSCSMIDYGCRIGSGVKIHVSCYIAQFTTIEDGAFLAPGVITTNDFHPGCSDSGSCLRGPRIESNAKIGGNVTLLPGVVIGRNSLVGAGSVVVRDVPPETVVAGNPARELGSVYELECNTGIRKRPYER